MFLDAYGTLNMEGESGEVSFVGHSGRRYPGRVGGCCPKLHTARGAPVEAAIGANGER